MEHGFTRRQFLASMGITASATLFGPSLLDFEMAFAQPALRVRPNIKDLTKDSPVIKSYAAAITAMKALSVKDKDDPRGWDYQAAIHNIKLNGAAPKPGWKGCDVAHHMPWFWPWHRLYLFYFERIVRQMSDDSFVLPFWDWQTDRKLPALFQTGGLPEFQAMRNAAMNNGTGELRMEDVSTAPVDAAKVFLMLTGASRLMERPHDILHGRVGGLMGAVPTSAQDPIFFLHHANVDRLWDKWVNMGTVGKPDFNDPVDDEDWGKNNKNTMFTFFDADKSQVMKVSCDCVSAGRQLNYKYDGQDQRDQACPAKKVPGATCGITEEVLVSEMLPSPLTLPTSFGPTYFSFEITSQLQQQILQIVQDPTKTIFFYIYGITTPTQPDVAWDVWLGLPMGAPIDTSSPYYVGAFGLFGPGIADQMEGHIMNGEAAFPSSTALVTTIDTGEFNMPITLLPAGLLVNGEPTYPAPASAVTIAHAQLIVRTVTC